MENKKLSEQELEQVSGGDVTSANIVGRGKNGNPTLNLWDEASAGLIIDEIVGAEKQEPGGKNR